MPLTAVATPTAADVWSDEMKDILNDIACNVWLKRGRRPTDVWLRLGNLVQKCPPSTLHIRSHDGCTALFFATHCRQPLICSLILARGANVETYMKENYVGLLGLFCNWESEPTGWGYDGAFYRARAVEAEVVRVLISGGVDADERTLGRDPLLSYACEEGHVEVVETLFAAPGERLGWEKSGMVVIDGANTPLEYAVDHDHLEAVKLLCQKFRPKVLAVSGNDGGLALGRRAREKGDYEVAEFLEAYPWDKIA